MHMIAGNCVHMYLQAVFRGLCLILKKLCLNAIKIHNLSIQCTVTRLKNIFFCVIVFLCFRFLDVLHRHGQTAWDKVTTSQNPWTEHKCSGELPILRNAVEVDPSTCEQEIIDFIIEHVLMTFRAQFLELECEGGVISGWGPHGDRLPQFPVFPFSTKVGSIQITYP